MRWFSAGGLSGSPRVLLLLLTVQTVLPLVLGSLPKAEIVLVLLCSPGNGADKMDSWEPQRKAWSQSNGGFRLS